MLNRLTVSALLQAVILAAALIIVLVFSFSAWDSWQRVQITNRIALVADASASMFKAMDRLRGDLPGARPSRFGHLHRQRSSRSRV